MVATDDDIRNVVLIEKENSDSLFVVYFLFGLIALYVTAFRIRRVLCYFRIVPNPVINLNFECDHNGENEQEITNEEMDDKFWKEIFLYREEAERMPFHEANKLLSENARLILKRKLCTCESKVDADFGGMIVEEALLILPELLKEAEERRRSATFTIRAENLEEKSDNKESRQILPLKDNVGYWLSLKGYKYCEPKNGLFQVVIKVSVKENSSFVEFNRCYCKQIEKESIILEDWYRSVFSWLRSLAGDRYLHL